jgi:Domain of unknown function (DUF1707)
MAFGGQPRYAFPAFVLVGEAPVIRPGDQRGAAATARGCFRASHAHREQMIDTIRAAFVQGRLTEAEFDIPRWWPLPLSSPVTGALRSRV